MFPCTWGMIRRPCRSVILGISQEGGVKQYWKCLNLYGLFNLIKEEKRLWGRGRRGGGISPQEGQCSPSTFASKLYFQCVLWAFWTSTHVSLFRLIICFGFIKRFKLQPVLIIVYFYRLWLMSSESTLIFLISDSRQWSRYSIFFDSDSRLRSRR